jgi:S-adenosylmethionine synthetase
LDKIVISARESADEAVEFVERKGLGHPDTICDALAEELSRSLCREYRHRFDRILHHNVDKALLCGGRAAPAFGGGHVIDPIDIYLAGRAISEVGAQRIPLRDIAVESSYAWLRAHMHALDPVQHLRIHALIRPGSQDLQAVFSGEKQRNLALANDTSVGVAHAPLSALERLVLAIEKGINCGDCRHRRPAWGEDVKVMGVRYRAKLDLTIACAMVGRYVSDMDSYLEQKLALAELAANLAAEHGFAGCNINVNTADEPASGHIYLTVTGTSAEAGDDGQVGRGNRVNGLITPCRPMSLEAAAGKNPVNHVGKIYNVVARDIAEALVAELPQVVHTQCLIVSQIGAPVTSPAMVAIKLATQGGQPVSDFQKPVEAIAADRIAKIPTLVDAFVAGTIELF